MNNYDQSGDVLSLIAPYNLSSGQPVLMGAIFCIAGHAASAGKTFPGITTGVFRLTAPSADVGAVGDRMYWDDTNRRVTVSSSAGKFVGILTRALAAGEVVATLALCGVGVLSASVDGGGSSSPFAPGKPTIGTATVSGSTVSVPFAAPASPGASAILDYQALLVDGSRLTIAASPAQFPLKAAGAYVGAVRARNSQDYGPWSDQSNSVTVAGGGGGADPLASYYAAVANRDTAPVKIAGIGDSWMEYRMAQSFGAQWTQLIQAQLRGKYNTAGLGAGGGIGYVPFRNVSIFSPYTNPWGLTGTTLDVASGGLGLRYTQFTSTQKANITVTGTSAILHYLKATSSRIGYYKVDGGAAVQFETNGGAGAASDDGFLSIPLGASGSHTLEIGWFSGGTLYLAGCMFFNGDEAKGFHFYEGGHTAYRTTDYMGAAPGAAATKTRIAAINPHLVILALGQNDFAQVAGSFISAAQYKLNLKQIIAEYRAAGVTASWLIVLSADTSFIKDGTQTSTWAQFQQAAKDVAAEDTSGAGGTTGVAVVSITDSGRIPASTGGAGGLWLDAAHVGNAGHVIVSDVIFGAINR